MAKSRRVRYYEFSEELFLTVLGTAHKLRPSIIQTGIPAGSRVLSAEFIHGDGMPRFRVLVENERWFDEVSDGKKIPLGTIAVESHGPAT